MRETTTPTNEEVIADMLAIYHELGYLTYSSYRTYGLYSEGIAERRFGTWRRACEIANIPMTRRSKRLIPMVTTRCLNCDEWFDRPTDDKSCRRCKTCRKAAQWMQPVQEGWETIAC